MVDGLKSMSLGEHLKELRMMGKELDAGGRDTGTHTHSLEISEELSQGREITLDLFLSR